MADYVLVLHGADELPDDGIGIRLWRVGQAEPVAQHAAAIPLDGFQHDGVSTDPQGALEMRGKKSEGPRTSIGDELWRRLTPGSIGPALTPLATSKRIYLDLRSSSLADLPWELLRHQGQYLFTGATARWVIGRPDRDSALPYAPPPIEHPLRVMVVVGNKPDDTRIRAREELLAIERAAHRHNPDVVVHTLLHPEAQAIDKALQGFRPHVFHFIGHGAGSEDAPTIECYSPTMSRIDEWDSQRIVTVFQTAPPRLVVLNACLTAGAPTAATSLVGAFLNAGCTATVTMMGEIDGTASHAFSSSLYEELFAGVSVDAAVNAARRHVSAIAIDGPDGDVAGLRSNWPLPRLTVRGDVAEAVNAKPVREQTSGRMRKDFVMRWDERWSAWQAMSGSYAGSADKEARLAVLRGASLMGKTDLLGTVGETRLRAGEHVLHVDLRGPTSGSWWSMLGAIAACAEREGFDATKLHHIVASAEAASKSTQMSVRARWSSAKAIPDFIDALEELALVTDEEVSGIVVVLDHLETYVENMIHDTILPLLCAPFVRRPSSSRLRMIIALTQLPDRDPWGIRPSTWDLIEVGGFAADEWDRAVTHFGEHWCAELHDGRRDEFMDQVENTRRAGPYAPSLLSLRMAAEAPR